MNKDFNKKKAELLKSIMSNPKLSKVFTEALSSPIGSSKRQQSKSILSVMKKLGGVRNDGQGGATGVLMPTVSSYKQPKDYSNMIIFPAAPKFKVKKEVKKMDGQGGPGDPSSFMNFDMGNVNLLGQPKTYTAPEPIKNPFEKVPSGIKKGWETVGNLGYNTYKALKPGEALDPNSYWTDYPAGSATPFGTVSGSTPSVAGQSKLGFFGATPLKYGIRPKQPTDYSFPGLTKPQQPVQGPTPAPEGYTKPQESVKTVVPGETKPVSGETASQPSSGIVDSKTQGTEKTGDIYSQAQTAVDQGTGSASFALGVANEKFGGSLEKYLDDLDSRIKKDFKVDEIEQSLNDITSMKANFVPTMENYIRGRDEYLKFVDNLIDQTNDSLMKMDTDNPAVKKQMDTYLTYLYTLKGRQNQRYGQFLNNAIADYNADFERVQNQYNTVYKQYNDTITRKATIAQNEYNTLYNTMADLYKNLEEAPIRKLNQVVLEQQVLQLHLKNIESDMKSGAVNYFPEIKEYKDRVLDKDGALLSSEILHLPSLYQQITQAGYVPAGLTDTIKGGMARGLAQAESKEEAFSRIKDYRNMINSLAATPGMENLAGQIGRNLGTSSEKLVSSYVLKNAANFKQALTDLTSGGWVGKSYLEKNDKEGWLKANPGLNQNILNDLYDGVKIATSASPEMAKEPKKIFTLTKDPNGNLVDLNKIANVPDQNLSDTVYNILSSMWAEEPSVLSAAASAAQ